LEQLINDSGCLACQLAYKEGKHGNKNKRNNPSILISSKSNDFNLVIDVCKTFREGAFDIFLKHEINGIDAVIISHEHAGGKGKG
jgi:phosphoribosyl 1,2-cyclic phosphodiesterase